MNINKNEEWCKIQNELEEKLSLFMSSYKIFPTGEVIQVKGLVKNIEKWKIYIPSNDHDPPHFHVIKKDKAIESRFLIKTLDFLNNKYGIMKENDKKAIKEFFNSNEYYYKKLKNEWEKVEIANKNK